VALASVWGRALVPASAWVLAEALGLAWAPVLEEVETVLEQAPERSGLLLVLLFDRGRSLRKAP
jgi:hypothetical protein